MLEQNDLQAIAQLMDLRLEKALTPVYERLGNMDSQLNNINSDIVDIKDRLTVVEDKLGTVEKDVSETKTRVENIETRVVKIEVTQENVTNKNIQLLFEGQLATTEKINKLDRIENTLSYVKSDTEVIKDVVSEHSGNIQRLELVK